MKKGNNYKEIKIMNYEYEFIQYALQQLKKSITGESVIDVLDEIILKLNN